MIKIKLFEKPITGYIILVILLLIISALIPTIINPVLKLFLTSMPSYFVQYLLAILGNVISVIIIFALFVKFSKINLNKLLNYKNVKLALILIIPIVLNYLLYIVYNVTSTTLIPVYALLLCLVVSLSIGLFEETIFRVVPITYLMKKLKSENKYMIILIVTSIVFGAFHLLSIFAGFSADYVIFQFIYCIGFGALMCAVYLRTRNFWVIGIGHGLTDFFGLLDSNLFYGFATSKVVTIVEYGGLILAIIFIIVGFYYIRSSKHAEMDKLWAE